MTESVGVIGAGVMGQGVALTLGQYGFQRYSYRPERIDT